MTDTKKVKMSELKKQVNVDLTKKGAAVIQPLDLKKNKKPPKKARQRKKKSTPYIESKIVSIRFRLGVIKELGEDNMKASMKEHIMEEYEFKMAKKTGEKKT